MYYPDLTMGRYHDGPFDPANWRVPLLYVGWLEHPHAYRTGPAYGPLAGRLGQMAEWERQHGDGFLGMLTCSFCAAEQLRRFPYRPLPEEVWSQENLFVPGQGVVYVSPGGIEHYVTDHSYLPPHAFVEAVLRCPDYGSDDYYTALRRANAGHEIPLAPT